MWEWKYLAGAICGVHIYDDSEDQPFRARLLEIDVGEIGAEAYTRDSKWIARIVCLAINLVVLLVLTIILYFKRINYEFGRASYYAAVGVDHRSGWVAFAALFPVLEAFALHLLNSRWAFEWHINRNIEVQDWRPRLALDTAAAAMA